MVYLFSGLLVCGCYGGHMTRKTNTVKGKKYIYYHCPTEKKGCTHPVMLKKADLIDCVLVSLQAHIRHIVSLDEVLDGISEEQINHFSNILSLYNQRSPCSTVQASGNPSPSASIPRSGSIIRPHLLSLTPPDSPEAFPGVPGLSSGKYGRHTSGGYTCTRNDLQNISTIIPNPKQPASRSE